MHGFVIGPIQRGSGKPQNMFWRYCRQSKGEYRDGEKMEFVLTECDT